MEHFARATDVIVDSRRPLWEYPTFTQSTNLIVKVLRRSHARRHVVYGRVICDIYEVIRVVVSDVGVVMRAERCTVTVGRTSELMSWKL